MAKARVYEVRGTMTVTVAIPVYARSEQEALELAEDQYFSPTTYCNNSVGVDGGQFEVVVEADCEIDWEDAYSDFCYTSESDCECDDWEDCWSDDYDDDEEDEEEDDE